VTGAQWFRVPADELRRLVTAYRDAVAGPDGRREQWAAADLANFASSLVPADTAAPLGQPDEPTVAVMVHYDGDSEQHYVVPAGDRETSDGDSGSFRVEIPASLWARHETASDEWSAAIAEIVRVAEVDGGRKLEPCPEWVGTLPDERPVPDWWVVWVACADDAPDAVGDTRWRPDERRWLLRGFPTEAEAISWADALPEHFHLLHGHGVLVEHRRADVTVERSPRPSRRSLAGGCERCGWDLDEHKPAEVAS
jgi:hypothetical protein